MGVADSGSVVSAAQGVDRLAALPALGVGLLYNPALPGYMRERPETFDYVEVIPEMFWTDHGVGAHPRFEELDGWIRELDRVHAVAPIICHNIGLSLGSADDFDLSYADHIAAWQARYQFPWHSDHLSFVRITAADGHDHNAGLAVPVPYDWDVLELICGRIASVQRAVPAPFMIENNVYFIDVPEQDMSEPEFLNALGRRTGCGLLLDIHNVYANARNHGFDAFAFIDALDKERVVEIHIAGGSMLAGMYTDSHAGPCPPAVWELLEWIAPQLPQLAAITFEFHDSYYPLLKAAGINAELDRARAIWERCRRA
ncbi:MAG TPA: DUF692 family multinuclear iron-containing protein [Candidatus Limnocylindria bacterium]